MRRFIPALLILVILLVAGCGLSNTMYNARNYFKAAQARPLNSNGRPSPQAVEEYTKTIQKCGIIISERKNGKQVEEALFLMSQALYFKGNSAFQAKDQFENLIRLFPESEYIPEANIFLAKIYREINQPAEAESRLETFIRDAKFRDYHPKALLTLADFEIQDKDYLRADFWLQRIITEYEGSKESYDAYFLMGKNLYVQKLYEQSNRQLEQLVAIRKATKELKLEARYYIALNQLALGRLEDGLATIDGVIKSEIRADKLSLARVLKARLLAASGNNDAAQQEFDAIMRDYPRTPSSSAAAYFLGDYQFFSRGDRAAATASYNRVRTESATGEYVSRAQAKVTTLQQLGQGANLNSENNLQQFLDYHYLAADNFERVMEVPDSSFALYRRVIDERGKLATLLDSITVQLDSLVARRDSLQTLRTQTALDDSLMMAAWADSTRHSQADSLVYAMTDSLEIPADSTAVEPDSSMRPQPTDTAALDRELGSIASDIQAKQNRISNINLSLQRFDNEIIPFVNFVKASLHMKLGQKDPQVADILAQMQADYPGNKYTNGIRLLYNGQQVRIIDPRIEEAEAKLDWAMGLYPAEPDSMVTALTELLETESEEIKLKSRFRLAWHYAIERADTTNARAYLESILESQNTGKYGDWSRRLFDGTNFLIFREAALVDTISEELNGDLQGAEADSSAWVEIPVFNDSLSVEPVPQEEAPPELPDQLETPEDPQTEQPVDLIDEPEPQPQEPLDEEAPLE